MYSLILLLLFTLSAAALTPVKRAGCTTTNNLPGAGKSNTQNLCVDSTQRSYILFLPANYNQDTKSRSLILSYHGGSKTAQDQLSLDLLTSPYFNSDSIVVYPSGIDETWQGVPGVKTDDIKFTGALLDQLKTYLRIDTTRIYATGKSQGAGFVGVLACNADTSKRIAAYAPVSGAFYTTDSDAQCNPETVQITCSNARNVPFIEFHGGKDTTISYAGGARKEGCLPSIPHYLTQIAVKNGLSDQNQTAVLTLDTVVYAFGDGLVRGYYDKSTAHVWPSTKPNSDSIEQGQSPATFNASSIIMDFFSKYTL